MDKPKRLLMKHKESKDPEVHVTPVHSLYASKYIHMHIESYLEDLINGTDKTCTLIFRIVAMTDDEVNEMEACA